MAFGKQVIDFLGFGKIVLISGAFAAATAPLKEMVTVVIFGEMKMIKIFGEDWTKYSWGNETYL